MRYLNTAASDIGEGLIQQLLISEHCNGPKDQKEFVSIAIKTCIISIAILHNL